mmetsp:Transcript_23017/g.41475  ORF Transcript_23017/g.41475 Transcript_23017/m.41475 type:complete len:328 (+) Transcript_23017:734-1717(+)
MANLPRMKIRQMVNSRPVSPTPQSQSRNQPCHNSRLTMMHNCWVPCLRTCLRSRKAHRPTALATFQMLPNRPMAICLVILMVTLQSIDFQRMMKWPLNRVMMVAWAHPTKQNLLSWMGMLKTIIGRLTVICRQIRAKQIPVPVVTRPRRRRSFKSYHSQFRNIPKPSSMNHWAIQLKTAWSNQLCTANTRFDQVSALPWKRLAHHPTRHPTQRNSLSPLSLEAKGSQLKICLVWSPLSKICSAHRAHSWNAFKAPQKIENAKSLAAATRWNGRSRFFTKRRRCGRKCPCRLLTRTWRRSVQADLQSVFVERRWKKTTHTNPSKQGQC